MTLRSFELAIDKFVSETIPEKVVSLQRVITLQILDGVVKRTPVDTGRARGNWQVSLEVPVLDILETGALGTDKRRNVDTGIVLAAEATIKQIKPFSVTYVQNNLPYIEVLEDGSSQQAPAGMLRVTIAAVEAQFR